MSERRIHPEELLKHRRFVRALAMRLIRDEHSAEDLVQQTWLTALERAPAQMGQLRAWLATVVKNLARDLMRADRRRAAREARSACGAPAPSTADIVEHVMLERSVVDAVLALDEPYRTAILLRFWEAIPPRKIARRLGVPVETVRARVRRGVEELRRTLDRRHGSRSHWGTLLLPLAAMRRGSLLSATVASPLGILTGVLILSTNAKVASIAVLLTIAAMVSWQATSHRESVMSETHQAVAVTPQEPAPPAAASAPTRDEITVAAPMANQDHSPAVEPEHMVVGRVIDDATGTPVVGAHVTAGHEHARNAPGQHTALSDADGRFRVEHVDKLHAADLIVESTDHAVLAQNIFTQLEGEAEIVDMGDLRLLTGVSVRGRLLASDQGSIVAGAFILHSQTRFWDSFLPAHASLVGVSASEGAFALAHLAYTKSEQDHLFAISQRGIGWIAATLLDGRARIDGIDIVLAATRPLTVSVRDADGHAIEDALVRAEPRFEPLFFGDPDPRKVHRQTEVFHTESQVNDVLRSLFMATTDREGVVRFALLPLNGERRRYEVCVTKAGFTTTWQSARLEVERETQLIITLPKSVEGAILGRVTTRAGDPVPGATLGYPLGAPPSAVEHEVLAETDEQGYYHIDGLKPPDEMLLWVRADGFAMTHREVTLTAAQPRVIDVNFALEIATPIAGRVVDQDHRPLSGVQVSLWRGKESLFGKNVRTLADGRFSFPDATEGEWTLQAWPQTEAIDEWSKASLEQPVRGGDREFAMVLTRLTPARATLNVEIVDAESGDPLEPTQFWLQPGEPSEPGREMSYGPIAKALGKLTIPRVRPGRWSLHGQVAAGWKADADFEVSETDVDVSLRVAVGHPGIISGRVVVDQGTAIGRLFVLTDRDGVWIDDRGQKMPNVTECFAIVGADGRFRFGEVTPGRVRLTLRGSGEDGPAILGDAEVLVPAHGEAQVELRPISGGTITVGGSTAAARCWVELFIAEGNGPFRSMANTQSDAQRTFVCRGLARPGHVRWRVTMRATNERTGSLTEPVVMGEGELDIALGDRIAIPLAASPR